ncbi:PPPDE putative peptidase domain-containing protein [Chaetomidium leptoderma]|uniref:PPPDE putative peptidase domain-containing protein n=1 Tax=Chaetomidium leptoderma TaxID=669021 RepID=A0AAN6VJU7_9PEZI|nr:PPPDE putative peptidase domain-containing protein [Chaetomidium leptoderma]
MSPARKHQKKPSRSHRSTLSLQKTEILINIYDLLPPGRMNSILWHMGTSLLHSGVVINGKEYAYGGHDRRGLTGVYWTKPRTEPPGGTFRCEYLHGFTLAPQNEIDAIIREASEAFLGTGYNLLTRNCNHFTSYLCERLTGQPAPGFLNRAASIGVALPCVVPREWIEVPDFDTADGALLDDHEEAEYESERARMLRSSEEQPRLVGQERRDTESDWDSEDERRRGGSGKGKGKAPARDTAGRMLPPAERAPVA